jgi:hypothetical protein
MDVLPRERCASAVRRVAAVLLGVAVLAWSAPPARAQSQNPAPPLALVMPAPAPAFLPPPRDPPDLPSVSVDLERRGHQKKVTGASLMAVGSLIAASGLAVLLDGALDHGNPGLCAGRCSGSDLVVAGSVGLAVGTAAAVTGIPIWLSGVSDAREALRLRDRLALPPPAVRF